MPRGKSGAPSAGEMQQPAQIAAIEDTVSKQIDALFQDYGFICKISQLLVDSLIEPIKQAITTSIGESVKDSLTYELQDTVDKVIDLQNKFNEIEDILDEQEQYSRRNCLVLYGVPENDRENASNVIMNIMKSNLNIDVKPGDIDRCHRLGSRFGRERPRGIIVKFSNYNIRDMVYRTKKRLKGSTPKMYIMESLTAKRAKLLDDLRKKYTDKLAANWTQDGRLYLLTKSDQRHVLNKLSDVKQLCL